MLAVWCPTAKSLPRCTTRVANELLARATSTASAATKHEEKAKATTRVVARSDSERPTRAGRPIVASAAAGAMSCHATRAETG